MTTTAKMPKPLTTTASPPAREGRHKTVLRNAQECAHRWAANDTPEGRAGNVFFTNGTIYSYGSHFPMARFVRLKGGVVGIFLTTRSYSATTAGHLCDVRRAIPGNYTVFSVPEVMANFKYEHERNFNAFKEDAEECVRKASKATKYKANYLTEAAANLRQANKYAEAVGLRSRVEVPDDLTKWAEEAIKVKAEESRKAAAKAKKERAEKVKEWEVKLAAWQAGGDGNPGHCPNSHDPRASLAFIRVRGTRLETTERAVVPLAATLPILDSIRTGSPLPDDFQVDGFQLLGIDRDAKLVTVGCHRVQFDEIDRAAKAAGL